MVKRPGHSAVKIEKPDQCGVDRRVRPYSRRVHMMVSYSVLVLFDINFGIPNANCQTAKLNSLPNFPAIQMQLTHADTPMILKYT